MSTMPWPARLWTGPSLVTLPWRRSLARFFRALEAQFAAEERDPAERLAPASRFVIAREGDGRWRVERCGDPATPRFSLLSEAIGFARRSCAAAPATIELRIGEIVAVVHQAAGWPHAMCREAARSAV